MTRRSETPSRAAVLRRSDALFGMLLNLPAILLILALIAFPVLYSLWVSLLRYNLRRPNDVHFVGLGNYREILTDPMFWHALQVTLYFAAGCVIGTLMIALAIALLFNETFKGRALARALLLVPWAMPGVVNGLLWRGMFGKYGGVNALLALFGADPHQSWLLQPTQALNAAIVAQVWKDVPFAAIIFLAALQAIPRDQCQAARVDGAGWWARLRYITLPWLLHPILIVVIWETMNGFRAFDLIFALTGGGPGRATHVIAWQTYTEAFRFLNFGAANAYSYLIALMTMTLSVVYIRLLYRRGQIQG
ncbi:MAG: sugar ABC transporter permease [Abditibacteriales bacterium]|nr:sugar ABC transporter permease [Abditibacteriales bacterium]MDW8364699.1 sugar ABC transporter permease [Abditibacteriales bacterium]